MDAVALPELPEGMYWLVEPWRAGMMRVALYKSRRWWWDSVVRDVVYDPARHRTVDVARACFEKWEGSLLWEESLRNLRGGDSA